jgi:hypothetical protein
MSRASRGRCSSGASEVDASGWWEAILFSSDCVSVKVDGGESAADTRAGSQQSLV